MAVEGSRTSRTLLYEGAVALHLVVGWVGYGFGLFTNASQLSYWRIHFIRESHQLRRRSLPLAGNNAPWSVKERCACPERVTQGEPLIFVGEFPLFWTTEPENMPNHHFLHPFWIGRTNGLPASFAERFRRKTIQPVHGRRFGIEVRYKRRRIK